MVLFHKNRFDENTEHRTLQPYKKRSAAVHRSQAVYGALYFIDVR